MLKIRLSLQGDGVCRCCIFHTSMKIGWLLLGFVWLIIMPKNTLSQGSRYWQQQVNYNLVVTLNDVANTLDGTADIEYINQSPDTLNFIWIHLWQNAFKNDKTAYSEQKLLMNATDFYFSAEKQRGYINRINFTVNNQAATVEDHPQYIDVVKLILPKPLLPGVTAHIRTPFHVKLPYKFSRTGYDEQYYSITQWFPKAALYDKQGWHEMPYLEWGEYFSDFGNYTVSITLPANYAVGATGILQDAEEINWLKSRTKKIELKADVPAKKNIYAKPKVPRFPVSATATKTLHYVANNVVDFAWFADKRFIVKYDTLQLANKTIDVWNFVLPDDEKVWSNSINFTKKAIRFYSNALGNYPYSQISVVSDAVSTNDGMEYPMITALNAVNGPPEELDVLIAHEVGHTWLMGILATNERDHAWMDEGFNTYFERQYQQQFYGHKSTVQKKGLGKKFPGSNESGSFLLNLLTSQHRDQPIATSAEKFTYDNYYIVSYYKTAFWLEKLEALLGKASMQQVMHQYYQQWQFKHPSPEDFRAVVESVSQKNLDEQFSLLHQTGALEKPQPTKTKITGLFNLNRQSKNKYIGVSPAFGFNNYDKFQVGLLVHNYNIPANPFQFVVTPMFATGSKQLTGYAHTEYNIYGRKNINKTTLYADAAHFNFEDGNDLQNNKIVAGISKFVPGATLRFKKKNALSTYEKWADFKLYIINEQSLKQLPKPAPAIDEYYDEKGGSETTVIPQLTWGWRNTRTLYPWSIELKTQAVKQIVRNTIEAKYFLNYNSKNEGIAIRFFAGKIFYTKQKTNLLRNDNSRYHFTMYAPNGQQDYTYSNAFADRNQSTTLWGRQIALRDGSFKYRSDYSSVQPGLKTNGIDYFDNWLATLNFDVDVPSAWNPLSVLPFDLPLKLFVDVGTSASPWQSGSNQNKFLYSAGLHLPLLKFIHVYYPLVQSKAFDEPNSVNNPNGPNWWQKRLTFNVDINNIKPKLGGMYLFDH